MKRIRYAKWICLLSMVLCVGCESKTEEQQKTQTEECQLTFLNTGKSDCILIEMEGLTVLNDTADADDYTKIQQTLDAKNADKVDYMIISHFDKDHIGSAANIIANNQVECVLMPEYQEDSQEYLSMLEAIQNKGVEKIILNQEYVITTEHGSISINAPHESTYKDENNYSLITTVTYQDNAVLLMGDALKNRTEEFLLDVPPKKNQYAIIKIPHHGDYHKKLKELLAAVCPEYAIITDSSAKERVEEKLLTLLEEIDCNILYTFEGDIVVKMNEKIEVEQIY